MKSNTVLKMTLTILSLGFAAPVFAANLSCKNPERVKKNDYWPTVTVTAIVADDYMKEVQLTELSQLHLVTSYESADAASLPKSPKYKPKIENRVRFDVDANATNNDGKNAFDGIVHGLILPEVLPALEGEATSIDFKAKVISSTDSYHDDINSYFPLNCTVSK